MSDTVLEVPKVMFGIDSHQTLPNAISMSYALVSNHALDDMLLAETHYTTPDLFNWAARGDEQSIVPYQQIWGELKNNPQELQRCINNIIIPILASIF